MRSAALLLSACTGPTVPASDSNAPTTDTAPITDSATEPSAGDTSVETVSGDWTRPEYDPEALPEDVVTLNIEIAPAAMARLDADPWGADDERGIFVDEDGVRHEVDLNYRGAYALSNVMSYGLRNWKVKLDSGDSYLERREWNLNYEPHFRQKLAYDLFRFAGVAVPGAAHVILTLNGEQQGLYLRYEDPDDGAWLQEQFGSTEGELYKAAYDLPGEPQCFALLTWLGDQEADYQCHYARKSGEADQEFAQLIGFLDDLNHLPDDDLADWAEDAVDVERLLSAMAVSNFIAQWDSYPQRPKNYWLYADPRSDAMVYIPWDLDAAFNPYTDSTYNQMGATTSVLYNLLQSDYTPVHHIEGTDRPLVRRLLAIPAVQAAYLDRYTELSETILSADYLQDRLDSLTTLVLPHISSTDRARLEGYNDTTRAFITTRAASVAAELSEQ
ncbi:MAG: spore coat protein CotH [Myxococcota bacterium]|jgi:spore coat protein CotH